MHTPPRENSPAASCPTLNLKPTLLYGFIFDTDSGDKDMNCGPTERLTPSGD